jgi:hypothetical protein
MRLDAHYGAYRYRCFACKSIDDIEATSLGAAQDSAIRRGWRLGTGRRQFRDRCPRCATTGATNAHRTLEETPR